MSFTPTLVVVVAGAGDSARTHLQTLARVKAAGGVAMPSGWRVLVQPALFGPSTDAMRALAAEFGVTLVGADPALLIDAPDTHVVVACADDATDRHFVIQRAVAAKKHVYAVAPIAADHDAVVQLARVADDRGLFTGVADPRAPDQFRRFLEGIVRRSPAVPSWREVFGASSPDDPADEIRAAIAALPPDAHEARARLLRALRLLAPESSTANS
ncbi:MAG: hypothetical protein NZ518_01580 [Dehalococcoidia bacterium]|nr:hypothetical protein [Dehalococcoidia bacterium]